MESIFEVKHASQVLTDSCNKMIKTLEEREKKLNAREEALKVREEKLNNLVFRVREESAKEQVRLNVGGTIFMTTKETLCKFEDTYFSAMLKKGNWKPDQDGLYFIDRDPFFFSRILNGMRGGELNWCGLDAWGKKEMKKELDFFLLSDVFCPDPAFQWSADRIGPDLKVDEDRKVITAFGVEKLNRVGISEKVFNSSEELKDSFFLKILNTGRLGVNGNNRWMEVLLFLFLPF